MTKALLVEILAADVAEITKAIRGLNLEATAEAIGIHALECEDISLGIEAAAEGALGEAIERGIHKGVEALCAEVCRTIDSAAIHIANAIRES